MKRKAMHRVTVDGLLQRTTWTLVLFVTIVALMGGGSRYDITSLPFLRAFSVLTIFALIAWLPLSTWRGIRVPVVLLALLALWMGIQITPLPPSFWTGLPIRDKINAIDQLLGMGDRWRPISLTPGLTVNSLLALSVPLAALFVAAALPAGQRIRLWWALWAFGLVSACFALLQFVTGPRSAFYLYRITNDDSLVGIFSNRNHNALMLCMAILAAGWLISNEIARRNRHPMIMPILIASIAIFLLLILTLGSRMGLICGVASVATVYLVNRWTWRYAPKPINHSRIRENNRDAAPGGRFSWVKSILFNFLPVMLFAGTAALLYFSDKSTAMGRLVAGDGVEDIRFAALGTVTSLVKQLWLFGSGFGSFSHVYQVVEPDRLLRVDYLNNAHNDWLQLPLEGGLPAVLIFLSGVGWISFQLIDVWRRRLTSPDVRTAETMMITAAFAILAFGSLVDYPLRTPSIGMVAAFLFVILCRLRHEFSDFNRRNKPASV